MTLVSRHCAKPGGSLRRKRARRADGLLVGGVKVGEEGRPARIGAELGALFEHESLRLLDAELLDDELEPRARAILALPEAREDPAHGLRDGKELLLGEELVEDLGRLRDRAQPAADDDLEAALDDAVDLARARDRAQVVEVGEAARVLLAARERDLELAPEVLRVVVAEQEERHGLRVGGDVERLLAADARVGAGGDVPNGVAARLARRDPRRRPAAAAGRACLRCARSGAGSPAGS